MATLYTSYILHCQTSVHAGNGTSTGTIDKPIQREATNKFPVFRDSTLRGAVREHFETPLISKLPKNKEAILDTEAKKFISTFGYRDDGEQSSALDVYPARLLFFPVQSYKGVFAYVTCPFVLNRFIDDMKLFHDNTLNSETLKLKSGECYATEKLKIEGFVGLQEFLFKAKSESFDISSILTSISSGNIPRLNDHIAIIDDTSFAYFTRLFTEKITRNKIDIKTGVAADTGLFNEEFLPEESILYSTFGFSNEFKESGGLKDVDIQTYFTLNFKPLFQLGGDKSIGKGLLKQFQIKLPTTLAT